MHTVPYRIATVNLYLTYEIAILYYLSLVPCQRAEGLQIAVALELFVKPKEKMNY